MIICARAKKRLGKLNNKLQTLAKETGTKKSLLLTLVTSYGVKPNCYSGMVQAEVWMDDLFEMG